VASSHRAAPWPIVATRIADFQRRDKRVLPFSGKPAVPLTKRYLVQRISRSHRQSRLTGTFYHRRTKHGGLETDAPWPLLVICALRVIRGVRTDDQPLSLHVSYQLLWYASRKSVRRMPDWEQIVRRVDAFERGMIGHR